MKRTRKHKGAIWEFLEASGVLQDGTDEEIKEAKNAYRKEYFLRYKRNQRANKPEFIINFSSKNGEYIRVKQAAERHKMTMTAFIRSSVLAYLQQRFLVPNTLQVAHLEEILSQCLNEIQKLVGVREKYYWAREEKFEAIEERIEKLEYDLDQVFRNPPLLQHDSQNKIL